MYAIIETGGKQYRVQEGEEISVERLSQQGVVQFDRVLLVQEGEAPYVGLPYLKEWMVEGEIIGEAKARKVIAFKYKKCKNYRRTVGHRQKYTRVKIRKISKI